MVISRTQYGTPQPAEYFVVNHGDYFNHNKADEINQAVDLIRNLMQEQGATFIGLDAEWGTIKSPDGRIIGSQGIATIQIAVRHNGDGGQYKARVFHLCGCDRMTHRLEAFVLDDDLTFVGCQVRVMQCIWNMCIHILYTKLTTILRIELTMQVTGDINKLFRDLGDKSKKEQVKRVELGSYAKKRGVIAKTTVRLDVLSKIVNDDDIDKTLQDSSWGNKFLTDAQKDYAATDAIVVLKVYNTLSKMPDLSV
jgi:hypothetical protein